QECGLRTCRLAHRNVQLVCRYDPEPWISKLPPELVPNGGDLYSCGRLWSILDRMDHSCRSQEQNDYDQYWNDRPGQLNLSTTVDLCRLTVGIRPPATELHDRVRKQRKDDDEYDCRDGKNKHRQMKNRLGRGGLGREDIRETR